MWSSASCMSSSSDLLIAERHHSALVWRGARGGRWRAQYPQWPRVAQPKTRRLLAPWATAKLSILLRFRASVRLRSDLPWKRSSRETSGWLRSMAAATSRALTGFALAVEIGDWHRFTGENHWRVPGLGSLPNHPLASPDLWARSPRPVTRMRGGCLLRRPGTT